MSLVSTPVKAPAGLSPIAPRAPKRPHMQANGAGTKGDALATRARTVLSAISFETVVPEDGEENNKVAAQLAAREKALVDRVEYTEMEKANACKRLTPPPITRQAAFGPGLTPCENFGGQ